MERLDSAPADIVAQAESYLWMIQFINKPSKKGSDGVKFIPATFHDRQLVAVIAERYEKKWTYSNNVRGIFINPLDPSFSIAFAPNGQTLDFVKFHDGRYRSYLVWMKNTPEPLVDLP